MAAKAPPVRQPIQQGTVQAGGGGFMDLNQGAQMLPGVALPAASPAFAQLPANQAPQPMLQPQLAADPVDGSMVPAGTPMPPPQITLPPQAQAPPFMPPEVAPPPQAQEPVAMPAAGPAVGIGGPGMGRPPGLPQGLPPGHHPGMRPGWRQNMQSPWGGERGQWGGRGHGFGGFGQGHPMQRQRMNPQGMQFGGGQPPQMGMNRGMSGFNPHSRGRRRSIGPGIGGGLVY